MRSLSQSLPVARATPRRRERTQVCRVIARLYDGLDSSGEITVRVDDEFCQQRVAACEVAVERRPGDAHLLADGVQREGTGSPFGKLAQRDPLSFLAGRGTVPVAPTQNRCIHHVSPRTNSRYSKSNGGTCRTASVEYYHKNDGIFFQ